MGEKGEVIDAKEYKMDGVTKVVEDEVIEKNNADNKVDSTIEKIKQMLKTQTSVFIDNPRLGIAMEAEKLTEGSVERIHVRAIKTVKGLQDNSFQIERALENTLSGYKLTKYDLFAIEDFLNGIEINGKELK